MHAQLVPVGCGGWQLYRISICSKYTQYIIGGSKLLLLCIGMLSVDNFGSTLMSCKLRLLECTPEHVVTMTSNFAVLNMQLQEFRNQFK